MPSLACAGFFFDQTYQSRYWECGSRRALLEPRMLVRGVVHDEVDQHAHAALLRAVRELDEIAERAVARIDAVVVGDVVAVVAMRRGLERHQPDGGDAQAMQIIQPARQTLESRRCRRRWRPCRCRPTGNR